MHEQTTQLWKLDPTRRAFEDRQSRIAWLVVHELVGKQQVADLGIDDEFGPLEALGGGVAEVDDVDLGGAGVGFEMQNHAAVGGEDTLAVDAQAGVGWGAMGEFVLGVC
jgi:hypothetical protein